MREKIAFSDLVRLLERRGFVMTRVKDSHRLFEHNDSKTVIMLPEEDPPSDLLPNYVASVRRTLDGRGVMGEDEFDEWMMNHSRGNGTRRASAHR